MGEKKSPQKLSTREEYSKLVEDHDAWLFDCDGK